MEKGKQTASELTSAFEDLRLNPPPKKSPPYLPSNSHALLLRKHNPRRLVSLCLGVVGQHLEDIITDLTKIAAGFPPDIKLAMLAIARRRKLLNDEVLIALADNSWELLDISGSDITDVGLAKVAELCNSLRALDISRCDRITSAGVSEVIHHCRSLEILRCGGCPRSNSTARRCISFLKPKLKNVEEESWEELDSMDIGNGAQSLRWLVWSGRFSKGVDLYRKEHEGVCCLLDFSVIHQYELHASCMGAKPNIDEDSKMSLATECPRLIVNPQPSAIGFCGSQIPMEVLASVALDHSIVEDIDPKTWAFAGAVRKPLVLTAYLSNAPEVHMAERFRLAFLERDARLAPKRAKNARQHRRRAEKEWLMSSTGAKAIALASQAGKFLHNRS